MTSNRDADVIVVGAGTGGLTTAAYLAAAGKRVLVVDRGSRPGGHGTVFERGGYQFDIGLHSIASGMDGRPVPDPLLAPLGIALRWNRIDPVETVVLDDGSRFELPWGLDAYRSALHEALPDERGAVDRYLTLIVELDKQLDAWSTATGLSGVPRALRSAMPLPRYRNTQGATDRSRPHAPMASARSGLSHRSVMAARPPCRVLPGGMTRQG